MAGSRLEISKETPEDEKNLLDTEEEEMEVPEEVVSEIKERTGEPEKKILEKIMDLNTTNPDEVCEALESEE